MLTKIDSMQKMIDRYETKIADMQKHIDSLLTTTECQDEQNKRLNNELTDLTDLHQIEMSSMKTDLKKLEDKLLYNFNEYWAEMVEKLDKLDTRVSFKQCVNLMRFIYGTALSVNAQIYYNYEA
jgi:predicted nuclease with TOPRIM domain